MSESSPKHSFTVISGGKEGVASKEIPVHQLTALAESLMTDVTQERLAKKESDEPAYFESRLKKLRVLYTSIQEAMMAMKKTIRDVEQRQLALRETGVLDSLDTLEKQIDATEDPTELTKLQKQFNSFIDGNDLRAFYTEFEEAKQLSNRLKSVEDEYYGMLEDIRDAFSTATCAPEDNRPTCLQMQEIYYACGGSLLYKSDVNLFKQS